MSKKYIIKAKPKPPKVYIVSGNIEYSRMFSDMGWEITANFDEASLIQFTGGADVSPILYGEATYQYTQINPARDQQEQMIYMAGIKHEKPMAGICRGGQFLNVMCGGKLWQHVEGHLGDHDAYDVASQKEVEVSSTHHQMMVPRERPGVKILLTACEARQLTGMCSVNIGKPYSVTIYDPKPDIEALHYKHERVLCFQPHPEFLGYTDLRTLYFSYLNLIL